MNDSGLGINKENLLLIVPPALTHDPAMMARAAADAEALTARLTEIDKVRVISNIDGLEEAVLDILARDFKVDWWDPEYSIEEKRRTLKGSWRVHKTLGTKAAVETAISAIYPHTRVLEWWEYGGEPYHFRLNIDITSDSGDRVRQRRVLERLNFYKSLRSHNDGVRYFLVPEKSWAVAGGLFAGSREIDRATIKVPELTRPGGKTNVLAGGGLTGTRSVDRAEIKIPELIKPGGRTVLTAGGVFTGTRSVDRAEIKIPELTRPGGRIALTAGGVFTGTWSVDRASVKIPPLKRPGAGTVLTTGGGFTGCRRRIDAAVPAPKLTRPKGAAERAALTGYIGSIERDTVKLDTGRVKAPTGRAAAAGAAGVFHSYQRMSVYIPTTISGR